MFHKEILIKDLVNGQLGYWEIVPIVTKESEINSDDKEAVWVNLGFIPYA